MMTIAELIEQLKTYPQDAKIAYKCYSEQCVMEKDDISLIEGCEPRNDGWVQNKRPDMPSIQYVLFPGN